MAKGQCELQRERKYRPARPRAFLCSKPTQADDHPLCRTSATLRQDCHVTNSIGRVDRLGPRKRQMNHSPNVSLFLGRPSGDFSSPLPALILVKPGLADDRCRRDSYEWLQVRPALA